MTPILPLWGVSCFRYQNTKARRTAPVAFSSDVTKDQTEPPNPGQIVQCNTGTLEAWPAEMTRGGDPLSGEGSRQGGKQERNKGHSKSYSRYYIETGGKQGTTSSYEWFFFWAVPCGANRRHEKMIHHISCPESTSCHNFSCVMESYGVLESKMRRLVMEPPLIIVTIQIDGFPTMSAHSSLERRIYW